MYDLEDELSLHSLKDWIVDAKKYSYNVMLVLWGNKADAVATDSVSQSLSFAVAGLMEEYEIPESLHFKVSANTGHNVKEAFEATLKALDERSSAPCPRSQPQAPSVSLQQHPSQSWNKCF